MPSTRFPIAALDVPARLLGLAGRADMPRPCILLEDGAGTGSTHLVWGARRRLRAAWEGVAPALDGDGPWYGAVAYEAGLPRGVRPGAPPVPQPLIDLFQPENRIVIDAARDQVHCEGPEALVRWEDAVAEAGDPHPPADGPGGELVWRSFERARFEDAVRRAQDHIAAGDIYQVNLAVAERWAYAGDPWRAYRRLRRLNPSPWMGYADFGEWQLVCGSPELLVEVSREQGAGSRRIRTRPIAGTRKKTGDAARNARMRAELALDAKEQAEHRMLVDLARNDVGRVAEFGSVRVSERETVEEYSHVFHLVSQVEGRLRPEVTADQVLAAMFPGGTITGCPKIRAMEIIAELEPAGRGAYTGALGWLGPQGMQLNIVIRSAVVAGGQLAVQAGAGIVADSIPEREWKESLRKAEAVRAAFGLGTGIRGTGYGIRDTGNDLPLRRGAPQSLP